MLDEGFLINMDSTQLMEQPRQTILQRSMELAENNLQMLLRSIHGVV